MELERQIQQQYKGVNFKDTKGLEIKTGIAELSQEIEQLKIEAQNSAEIHEEVNPQQEEIIVKLFEELKEEFDSLQAQHDSEHKEYIKQRTELEHEIDSAKRRVKDLEYVFYVARIWFCYR